MEQYTKYLPVEGEIEEENWYFYLGQLSQRLRKNPKAEYPTPQYQKAKLFLCSRDIQVGNEVYIETKAVSQQYQSPINGKGIIQKINNKHEILIYRNNGELLPFDCSELTKVIGEISPDATWVKEGDEFDETNWRFKWYNNEGKFFTRHEYHPSDEFTNLGEGHKDGTYSLFIQILGPCKHFH